MTPPPCWAPTTPGCWGATGGRPTASSPTLPTRAAWRTCCAAATSCSATPSAARQRPRMRSAASSSRPGGPRCPRRRPAGQWRRGRLGRAAGRSGRQAHRRTDRLPAQPQAAGSSPPGAPCAVHLSLRPWGPGDQLARRARHPPRGRLPQAVGRQRHLERGKNLAGSRQRAAHRCPTAPRPGHATGRTAARTRPRRGRPRYPHPSARPVSSTR
jgi:hypothetical protein